MAATTSPTPSSPSTATARSWRCRAKTKANLGAYLSTFASSVPTYLYAPLLSGQYDIPAIYCEVDGVYTNTAPVDAYRGAGRPEATFVVERLVEVAARQLGHRPRRVPPRNFIQFPHQTPVIMTYDAGDYAASLNKALEIADYKGRAQGGERQGRQAARHRLLDLHRGLRHRAVAGGRLARRRRRPVGIGRGARQPDGLGRGADRLAQPRPGPRDHLRPAGLAAARHPHRAGHGRARRHRQGAVRHGHLRLALGAVGMSAIAKAIDKVIAKGKKVAAFVLEAAEGDIEFKDGIFSVTATNKTLTFREVALQAYIAHKFSGQRAGARLEGRRLLRSRPTSPSRPACTSARSRSIRRRRSPDRPLDRGRRLRHVINPMIVEGQVHGGIAQGGGPGAAGGRVYDKDGQLVTASYMDYTMPRAGDLPSFQVGMTDALPVEPAGRQGLRRGRRHRGARRR